MPTLESTIVPSDKTHGKRGLAIALWLFRIVPALAVGGFLIFGGGCSRDPGMEAIETDANGYLCQKCHAKISTDRKVFPEKCPKCNQDALVEVVGFMCPRDHHLTLRPRVSGPEGAAVCEQCNASLKSAMVQPRKKDLEAWGAIKAGSP
jgi:DNA-directed RNA polymerase subunit RPC12/RpoP